MRKVLFIAVWLAATAAATGLGFAAVAVVDDVASPPEAILAPVPTSPTGGRVSEFDVDDGALAVECAADDTITLLWARPSGGYTLSILESGPQLVRVGFAEPDEVNVVDVVCVGGVAVPSQVEHDDGDDDLQPPPDPTSTTVTEPTDTTAGSSVGSVTTVDDSDDDESDEPDEPDDDESDDEEPDEPDEDESEESDDS